MTRKGGTIDIPDDALSPASAKPELVARLSRADRATTLPSMPAADTNAP